MPNVTGEYDFPTIRAGAYALTLVFVALSAKIIAVDASPNALLALGSTGLALGATHAILATGSSFSNSRFARPKEAVEETVTTTRTVAPATTPAKVDTVNVAAENVNVS
jgi:hypothetical protein